MSDLAHRYASALYDTGMDEALFKDAAYSILNEESLWRALLNPMIRPEEKSAVIEALPFLSDSPSLVRFFQLLSDNHRIHLLPDIISEFHSLVLERTNTADCIMTCLHIPSEDQQKRLRDTLCRLHHKNDINLIFEINPALLGGFTLDIEGVTYDKSILGRLRSLSHYLEEVSAT